MGKDAMDEVVLTLPMLPNMELTAGRTACALGEHIRMSPDKIDEVRMAVVEACINAFEYSQAADNRLFVEFQVLGPPEAPDGLQVTVRDNGIGFSPERLVEPRMKDKLGPGSPKSKRGWGLKIIHGLMDEVDIRSNATGTTVVMRKMR